MNKQLSNFFSKCIAVMAIIFGSYLMAARMAKIFPFGIVSEDIGLIGVWSYMGYPIAAILVCYGLLLFFRRPISRFIRKLPLMWK